MTTIEPLAPGLHARSEQLVQTTRDHDRDRVDDETLHEAQTRDTENLLGVQTHAGFTTLTPGLVTWQDPFRPFTHILENLHPDTLTRFLDTNTFYRRPEIQDDPQIDANGIPTLIPHHIPTIPTDNGLITLPAPTAWVTAARDDDGDYPDPQLAHTLAQDLYPPLLDAIQEQGYTTLALTDPWIQHHPDPPTLANAHATLHEHQTTDLTLLAHLPFQDASPHLEAITRQPLDGTLLDLHQTPTQALQDTPHDHAIGLGLVDARSSLIERDDLLLGAIETATDAANTDTFYLTPTGSLQHVPEPIARKKIRTLGTAAQQARAKLGGASP